MNIYILILILISCNQIPIIFFTDLVHLLDSITLTAYGNKIPYRKTENTKIEDNYKNKADPSRQTEPLSLLLYNKWIILHQLDRKILTDKHNNKYDKKDRL